VAPFLFALWGCEVDLAFERKKKEIFEHVMVTKKTKLFHQEGEKLENEEGEEEEEKLERQQEEESEEEEEKSEKKKEGEGKRER